MKKIEAVIVPSNLDAVRKEFVRRGIRGGLTVVDVQHTDSEKRLLQTEDGISETFRDRIKLELIVDDSEIETTVNVILRQAQPEPDKQGGQIAVLEVNTIQRIGKGRRLTFGVQRSVVRKYTCLYLFGCGDRSRTPRLLMNADRLDQVFRSPTPEKNSLTFAQ